MAVFRGHGEMEEMEMEDINCSDDPTKVVQTRTPEETPKSGLRLFRLVVFSFGLLCVLQAILNISLRLVLFEDLTRERDQLQTSNNNLMKERDDLQKRLCEKTHCEDGWTRFGCSCYYVSTEVKTWEESRQDCIRTGADLVIVNNREEQEFLFNFSSYHTFVWIGLTDRDVEGTWTWVDGTPLTTEFWYAGFDWARQPDNGKNTEDKMEEDCAGMYPDGEQPVNKWVDAPCGVNVYWVCEREI